MKILYEGAIYQILRCGGVSRCFSELIRHLPADCQPAVVGPANDPPSLSHPNLSYHAVQTEPSIGWMRKWTREAMQRQIAQRFESTVADLEHWTYYNGLCRRGIVRGERPLVVTVLDFIHETFPSLDPSGTHVALKHEAIRAADHLICISQATHDEMCDRIPAARAKATVVPLGTSLADVDAEPLPSQLVDRPYVLFVGRRNSYKNFQVVWDAWNRLRNQLPADAKLVVVGPPMKRREATDLNWPGDGSAVLMPNASDGMLRTLYQHSQAFIFPSKSEGFGLPSLEAMSAGAPVLVSDLPVMREVVGDCGYYFDPHNVDDVADLIRAALTDALPDRAAMVAAGRRRADSFSWDSTAQQTAQVYRQVVQQFSFHDPVPVTADPTLCMA
ncbi:glycosyltransferase family 4 protein [Stieleria sp. TO1_6]|uniref:glycosyltransferase family 4 protein n=1 Tax=Stieleria tagensis TaxID=2956795 RepID=UPI00209A8C18|nr:glycosyltransferase family 1 protein [Stieleria tagensis]MCO8120364.1 glycosyltransferase family 4 protein [Stieleria tagensis]